MDYFNKIKEHWLISTIIFCGIISVSTWMLYANLTADKIDPSKDVTMEQDGAVEKTAPQPGDIVKTEDTPNNETKSLQEGTSFASKFGFTIYISGSNGDLKNASIFITLKDQKDRNYTKVNIGQKIRLKYNNNRYSIEVDDIRGDWVDLTIRKKA